MGVGEAFQKTLFASCLANIFILFYLITNFTLVYVLCIKNYVWGDVSLFNCLHKDNKLELICHNCHIERTFFFLIDANFLRLKVQCTKEMEELLADIITVVLCKQRCQKEKWREERRETH